MNYGGIGMNERRFTEIISIQKVIDNKTGKEYDCLIDDDLLKLLNELAEENIKLHIQNDFLKDENHHMRDLVNENRQLKEENKELKQELLEIIDASSDNRPNKKGFAGTGRFA